MHRWPPEVIEALARKVGARVVRTHPLHDGELAYEVCCPSHAAKVSLLRELAELDSRDPDVRRVAERVVAGERDQLGQIAALHAFVRDGVLFTKERRETFSPALLTLEHGLGDCDDTALVLCALLLSLGFEAGMLTLGAPPRHVACGVRYGGKLYWLETTLAAEPGEHPLEAAERLGVKVRPDLAGAARIPEPPASTVFAVGAIMIFALVVTWWDLRTRGQV
jgi:transglutaminase-like putative cysteine protease